MQAIPELLVRLYREEAEGRVGRPVQADAVVTSASFASRGGPFSVVTTGLSGAWSLRFSIVPSVISVPLPEIT